MIETLTFIAGVGVGICAAVLNRKIVRRVTEIERERHEEKMRDLMEENTMLHHRNMRLRHEMDYVRAYANGAEDERRRRGDSADALAFAKTFEGRRAKFTDTTRIG